MGFIDRELARLHRALDVGAGSPRYFELYAAQQALAWAMEPEGFASPSSYLTDTQEGSGDCPAYPGPLPS